MNTKAIIPLAALCLCMALPGRGAEPISESRPPERSQLLSEMLRDTNSSRLSPQEEREHTVRVRRLQELETAKPETVIQEPAGAAIDQPVAPQAQAADPTERLIEAVEQVQMEIRELRKDMKAQRQQSLDADEAEDVITPTRDGFK